MHKEQDEVVTQMHHLGTELRETQRRVKVLEEVDGAQHRSQSFDCSYGCP